MTLARSAVILAALAPGAAESAGNGWLDGSSSRGTRGVYRIEGAYALPTGDVALVLSAAYSRAVGVFADGDTNERHVQFVNVVWSPLKNLELWGRQSVVSNRNAAFQPATNQTLGDPSAGIKYSLPLGSAFGAGAGVSVLVPTSAQGTGINAEAYVLTGYAAASYLARPWLVVSANAGYVLDHTGKIFNREILPVQRFTANVSEADQVLVGLGANTRFQVGETWVLGPFAEVGGGVALGVALEQSPLRATGGVRLFPFGADAVELSVGGDFAVTGTPKLDAGTPMAGIPPWEAFAQLTVHLGALRNPAATCGAESDCASGQVCAAGICAAVKEVVKEVVREVTKQAQAFVIEGSVVDAGGAPLGSAAVSFSGVEGSALAVDYKTGNFRSWPIPSGDGLIKVTAQAPEYRPSDQTLSKGQPGEVKTLVFKLHSLGEAAFGQIEGSLKDARSGNPVLTGQVFIPILNQKVTPDAEGKFTAKVKAGRYQILITSKRHVTQKKEIEIRAGDTVILNVDLAPKR